MKEKLSSVLSGFKRISFLHRAIFVLCLFGLTAAMICFAVAKSEKAEESRFSEEVFEITDETLPEESKEPAEEPEKPDEEEFIPVGDIRIPHCGDINYSLATKTSDFYFENPASNSCYLKVSITRLDTKENIYSSTLISPGNSISGVGLKLSKQSNYKAMIKVDAYALDRMVHLNSLAINTVIYAY